jgi:hypothetical protein
MWPGNTDSHKGAKHLKLSSVFRSTGVLWTGLLLHLRNVNTKRFYIGIAIVTGQRIQLLLCGGIKRHTVTPRLVGPLCLSNSYTQPPVGSRVGAYMYGRDSGGGAASW